VPTPTSTATPTPTNTVTPLPYNTPFSLTFQQGIAPDSSYAGVADTFLNGLDGLEEEYGLGWEMRLRNAGMKNMLLRFDLSYHVPPLAIVTQARLELYPYNRVWPSVTTAVGAFEILRPWNELESNWNVAALQDPWQAPGCAGAQDRSEEAVATTTVAYTRQWYGWQDERLLALVQRWVANPAVNHGLALVALPGTARQEWTLYSSQNPTERTFRPRLALTFYVPPPTPTPSPTWTATPTVTPLATWTPTASPTPTVTATSVASKTATQTTTPSRRDLFLPLVQRGFVVSTLPLATRPELGGSTGHADSGVVYAYARWRLR